MTDRPPPPPMPIPRYAPGTSAPPPPGEKVGGHRWLIGALAGCGLLALASLAVLGYVGYRAWKGVTANLPGQQQLAPATPAGLGCFEEVARHHATDPVVRLAAGDVDADLSTEVVGLAGTNLIILDQSGTVERTLPTGLTPSPVAGWGGGTFSLVQGGLEIAVIGGQAAIVATTNVDPTVCWYRSDRQRVIVNMVANTQVTCLATGDLDGDGEDEILVGRNSQLGLTCLDQAGITKWKHGGVFDPSYVVVADATGDGKPEVYVGSMVGQTDILDGDGQKIGHWSASGIDATMAAADLDGDGTAELVGVGSGVAQASAGGAGGSGFQAIFDMRLIGVAADGSELWSQKLGTGLPYLTPTPLAAGDLDADGTGEWIASSTDGTVRVYDADGNEVGRYATGGQIFSLALADPDAQGGKPRLWVSLGQDMVGLEWQDQTATPAAPSAGDDN